MQVTITVGGHADALLDLRSRLIDEDPLRGRVSLVGDSPAPGHLGSGTSALLVALASGAAPALMHAWVAWLRYGRGGVTAKLTRPDGAAVELSVDRVRDLAPDQVAELIDDLLRFVDATGTPPDTTTDAGTPPDTTTDAGTPPDTTTATGTPPAAPADGDDRARPAN